MNVVNLLCELRTQGIRLWEEDGELRFRAPSGAMTAERRESLRQSKAAILDHLRSRPTPELVPALGNRCEPFPLTDLQVAYMLGRRDSFAYGGVGCHGYGEISLSAVDLARLNAAWRTLLDRHDMLRAVILSDGTQQVLEDVPSFTIEVLDLRQADPSHAIAELKAVRAGMDHRVYQPDQWPLFDLRVTMLPQCAVLHFSIDLLIADFVSTQIILQDLEQLMANDAAALLPLDVSYRDYVLAAQATRQSDEFAASRSYWMARLDDLPPAPELPLLHIGDAGSPRFRRHDLELVPDQWGGLCCQARELELTPSTAVLALFAEVVARWSSRPSFTLNVTIQNRLRLHPHIDRVVGDFTAVELLAVTPDPHRRLRERADALQKRLWEDLDHRAFSGTDVLRELARRRHQAARAFPVVFTSSIGLGAGNAAPQRGLGKLTYGITQTPQVWIDCQAIEDRGALKINWDVRDGVFPPGLVEAMFEAFTGLLTRAARDRSLWDEIEPVRIPDREQKQSRNADHAAAPASRALLHEGVVEQALRHPGRPAVIAGDTTLTFGELLTRASAVADAVSRGGHSPGDLVAVMLEPGWEQPVAVLGILLAGCAYLHVDPAEPSARRRQILDRFNVRSVLVTMAEPGSEIAPAGLRSITLAALPPTAPPSRMPDRLVSTDAPAFVALEAGAADGASGAAISHSSAVTAILDISARFGLRSSDRVLALSTLSIGPSVYDLFGVLAAGGCLVMPKPWGRADPAHWIDLIGTHGVTLWNTVPQPLVRLIEHLENGNAATPCSLRLAFVTGDWLPVTLPRRVREFLPGLQFVMLGTATENAIWSVNHKIDEPLRSWLGFPCGRAVGGHRLHVLDQALRDCPDWVAGDLYTADAWPPRAPWCDGAARGLGVRHEASGAPLYRMQTRARHRDDGLIEVLGRADRQVVLDGHSVNLGEVEAALAADPQVAWAAALVIRRSATRNHRIVAFIEPVRHPDCISEALRGRLVTSARQAATLAIPGPAGLEDDLNGAVCASIANTLTAHGLLKPGATLQPFHPQRRRLVRRWFRVLERRGLVVRDPQTGWPVSQFTLDRPGLAARWQHLEETWGDGSDQSELIAFCRAVAERFPEILDTGAPPVIMSRDDRRQFIHAVHNSLPLARWAGQTIATIVANLGDAGSHLTRMLDVCGDPDRRPFLDLDRPYHDQGFRPGSLDIIVSQNALHGARDLEASFGQLVQLLSPGGWMVFSEPIGDRDWVVGTLECFLDLDPATGDFLDRRGGRDETFLSAEAWRDLVVRHGGELVASTADQPEGQCGIAVFAARFNAGQASLDAHHLIAAAHRRLPAHMVPYRVEVIATLPWTPHAMIDYWRLQSRLPTEDDTGRPPLTAGSRELEDIIAALWGEVLQTDRFDPVRDFLSAGGDLLKAARLAGRLREAVPSAASVYFDELLQAILKGGTIADLAAILQDATDRREQDDGSRSPGPVMVRQLGGTGKPAWVIVPDGVLSLDHIRPLADLLRAQDTVFGIEIGDVNELLRLPAKTLVATIADRCLDMVINDGHLSIAVLGVGRGCPLAVEIARQMLDAGGVAERLVLAPAEALADSGCTEARLWRHWAEACNAWDAGAYAGDITLVVRQDGPDATQRWSNLCLGEFSVVAHAEPAALVEALKAPRQSSRGQRTRRL